MKPSRRVTVIASVMLIACLSGSIVLLQRLDRVRTNATLEEVLFVPSPKVLKRLSLGYDGLLADIYWTRAVQYFGAKHHDGTGHYDLLAPLLEITTTLDPHLTVAYEFGATFLSEQPPNGAGQPQRAVKLVEYGIQNNPNVWRLYYNLGYIHYLELKDYNAAAEAFIRGSKVPNAHPALKILAGQMAARAGDIETSRLMWTITYDTVNEKSIRANAAAHLRALQVDEDVTILGKILEQYRLKTGGSPRNYGDLIAAGFLRGVPVDPLGRPYKLTDDGRIEVQQPDDLPFITKGLPFGYVAPKTPKFLPSDM